MRLSDVYIRGTDYSSVLFNIGCDSMYEIDVDELIQYIINEAEKEHLIMDGEAVETVLALQEEYIDRYGVEVKEE